MTERRPDPKSQASPAVRRMADRLDEILREIESSATLAAELLAKTGTERTAAVRTEVRFHGLKLCELLLTKSREASFSDPIRSLELAELAVAISDRLDVGHYGEEPLHLAGLSPAEASVILLGIACHQTSHTKSCIIPCGGETAHLGGLSPRRSQSFPA